jgi:hypothetical protein
MDVEQKHDDSSLTGFCQYVINNYGPIGFRDPELLANCVRKFYGAYGALRLKDLQRLTLAMGISSVDSYKPVGDERGMFFRFGSKINLLH